MDFTPLYQLRERLKAGAVAGCGLISEDFRLKKAMEAMEPLEGASPVFKKIGDTVRNLFQVLPEERGMVLLDALTLCDAVLTTQGSVAVSGPIEAMPVLKGKNQVREVPYSILEPLLDAFLSSGSGRYATIMEAREEHPELFDDIRIRCAMVGALGASYTELADKVEAWLLNSGPDIVPLLKAGFDPKGKKEMVRRVRLIDRISSGEENEFYRSMVEQAEKEVKPALVYALRHREENEELLINITKTEKSPAKKMAYWALGQMDSPAAVEYMRTQIEKKPWNMAEYLMLSQSEQAGVLVVENIMKILDSWSKNNGEEISDQQKEAMQTLMLDLVGKWGEKVCGFYKKVAALGNAFDKLKVGPKCPVVFIHAQFTRKSDEYSFSRFVPEILALSVLYHPSQDLMETARELYRVYGGYYASASILSDLLTKESQDAYESAREFIEHGFRLAGKKKQEKMDNEILHLILDGIGVDENNRQRIAASFFHPCEERYINVNRYPYQPLAIKWYEDMMDRGREYDEILIRMAQPGNQQVCDLLSPYLYEKARKIPDNERYVRALSKMGWTDFDGFLRRFCEGQKYLYVWDVRSYAEELPVSNAKKARELEEVLKKIDTLDKKNKLGSQAEAFRRYLDELYGGM